MEKEKSNKNLRVTGTIKKRRSALVIMGSLIGLVNPLLHIMLAAIALGTLGYLCAIFLTILAGQVIIHGLMNPAADIAILAVINPDKDNYYYYVGYCGPSGNFALCRAVLQPFYCFQIVGDYQT